MQDNLGKLVFPLLNKSYLLTYLLNDIFKARSDQIRSELYRGRLDVDVADYEQSSNDVAMCLGSSVDDEQRRQHDGGVAGSVLASHVAHARVQQTLHHADVTLRHGIVQCRVTLHTHKEKKR